MRTWVRPLAIVSLNRCCEDCMRLFCSVCALSLMAVISFSCAWSNCFLLVLELSQFVLVGRSAGHLARCPSHPQNTSHARVGRAGGGVPAQGLSLKIRSLRVAENGHGELCVKCGLRYRRRTYGACAVMFCFTIADDFNSTGTPCIR